MAAVEQCNASKVKVRLYPFIHQVGGSSLMFKFDHNTICKPLLPKEYQFYKILPEDLKEFTAQYKGSIEIQCKEETDGTCKFFGIVPIEKFKSLQHDLSDTIRFEHSDETRNGVDSKTYEEGNCYKYVDFLEQEEFRVKKSGSIEMDEDSLDCYHDPMNKLEAGSRLNKKLAEILENAQTRFILLENLVATFKHPSILDLKMGTRTYGDDENDGKKLRKQRRAENSTSKKLGVRLHGMQKYNSSTGKYETIDKYQGLKYAPDEFKQSITNFLFDGVGLRQQIILPIIQRLKQFHDCVSQQDTFRFYSSSLLIIYDGGETLNHPIVNVKAIDFAHTTYQSSSLDQQYNHSGPDKGYLQGIQTLIDIFSECTN